MSDKPIEQKPIDIDDEIKRRKIANSYYGVPIDVWERGLQEEYQRQVEFQSMISQI